MAEAIKNTPAESTAAKLPDEKTSQADSGSSGNLDYFKMVADENLEEVKGGSSVEYFKHISG